MRLHRVATALLLGAGGFDIGVAVTGTKLKHKDEYDRTGFANTYGAKLGLRF